jgi:hypothetical protein
VAVNAFSYRKADETVVTFAGADSFALDDETSGLKVWLDVATNTLAKGTSWPGDPTTYIPIAEADTADGSVVEQSIRDRTDLLRLWIPATSSSPSGTTSPTFLTDSDNAGAGADGGLKHNRGTSGGNEDAFVKWVEAAAKWLFLAQDVTGTLAPIDVASLLVAGATVLDATGALMPDTLEPTFLYAVGPNGSSPAGLKFTPMGSSGPPSSGAHTKGETAGDSLMNVWICTGTGTPGTWQRIGEQGAHYKLSIGSVVGASPQDVTIQLQDAFGQSVSADVIFEVAVFDDANGAAIAGNATISVQTGTSVRDTGNLDHGLTAAKWLRVKTDASGQAVIRVTNGTAETVYLLATPGFGSVRLDCSDSGSVQITS